MRRSPRSIRDNIPREIWASAQICSRVLPEALMRCDVSMPILLHSAKADGKTEFYSGGMARGLPACKSPVMRFRLRQFRTDRRLTQVQVAEALGISVGLYNQLESGKRRMNQTYWDGLSKLYRVSPGDLLDSETDDALTQELLSAFRDLTPDEQRMLVASAKGILAGRPTKQ